MYSHNANQTENKWTKNVISKYSHRKKNIQKHPNPILRSCDIDLLKNTLIYS